MKNILYLVALLTCYQAQATLGDAVDFVTELANKYNRETPKQSNQLVVMQRDIHPAKKLACQFAKGFCKAVLPGALYIAHRGGSKLYYKGSVTFPNILKVNEQIVLIAMGLCLGDVINTASALITPDHGSVVQSLAHVAGLVTAIVLQIGLKDE